MATSDIPPTYSGLTAEPAVVPLVAVDDVDVEAGILAALRARSIEQRLHELAGMEPSPAVEEEARCLYDELCDTADDRLLALGVLACDLVIRCVHAHIEWQSGALASEDRHGIGARYMIEYLKGQLDLWRRVRELLPLPAGPTAERGEARLRQREAEHRRNAFAVDGLYVRRALGPFGRLVLSSSRRGCGRPCVPGRRRGRPRVTRGPPDDDEDPEHVARWRSGWAPADGGWGARGR